jgi:hypothetical protein
MSIGADKGIAAVFSFEEVNTIFAGICTQVSSAEQSVAVPAGAKHPEAGFGAKRPRTYLTYSKANREENAVLQAISDYTT